MELSQRRFLLRIVRAAPDGNTLLVMGNSFVINPNLKALSYDPLTSFEPICQFTALAQCGRRARSVTPSHARRPGRAREPPASPCSLPAPEVGAKLAVRGLCGHLRRGLCRARNTTNTAGSSGRPTSGRSDANARRQFGRNDPA